MGHFNPGAILAAYSTSETGSLEAYKDMTAVDFTGYGDVFNATDGALKQYGKEWNGNLFYPPLLDDGGLLSLRNAEQSVETPVSIAGIYIVRDAEGRHTHKIAVRK